MAEFSGLPETRWELGDRIMTLLKPFSYTDKKGEVWLVNEKSWINGATIPRALWTVVGSPFVGKYRRASIIHDFYVGEGSNPNVSYRKRRRADKMFYRACRTDGVRRKHAIVLYIGVSLGSWASRIKFMNYNKTNSELDAEYGLKEEMKAVDDSIFQKYNEILSKMDDKLFEDESVGFLEDDNFIDELERFVEAEIFED